MSGSIMQLAAIGTIDTYITGNPKITFFKSVFRRYTNFAMESRKINFNGTPDFGSTNNSVISKGPDLLHKLYLQVKLPNVTKTIANNEFVSFRWLNWIGHRLLKDARVMIDGAEIDNQHGEWLHLWNELSQKPGHKEAYAEMVGNVPGLTQIVSAKGDGNSSSLVDEYVLYIPLQFWFCRNPGLALPLVSLKDSDIEVEIVFEELDKLIWASHENSTNIRKNTGRDIFPDLKLGTTNIYADYIYLDNDERKRFAQQNEHSYLIEVVQERGTHHFDAGSAKRSFNLTFTHPVKELVWIIQPKNFIDKSYCQSRGGCQPFNFTDKFDYSGFSGTPTPSFGNGMAGGRTNSNLLYSFPGIKLPFIKDIYEPNFSTSETNFNSSLISTLKTASNTPLPKYSGYDYISKYHPSTTAGTTNKYTDKNVENYFGNNNPITVDENGATTNTGIWSNSNLDLKLIDNGKNPVKTATMNLNSVRRFDDREGFYFNTIQPYQHHTNNPAPGINVYSFALEPEDHKPTGTCNFTKIDNGFIEVELTTNAQNTNLAMRVYALSYTILSVSNNRARITNHISSYDNNLPSTTNRN